MRTRIYVFVIVLDYRINEKKMFKKNQNHIYLVRGVLRNQAGRVVGLGGRGTVFF